MKQRPVLVVLAALALAGGFVACASKTPTTPSIPNTPVTPVDPGPVVVNTPPSIGTIKVQGTGTNEPPNYADVSEEVPVSVLVTDAESPISTLKFNWSSSIGTFIGTGSSVLWKAPATLSTPTVVTINLEVVETYTSQGKSVENKPTASTTVAAHDSVKEVGTIAKQFLDDFSDSSIPVASVMKNFETGCYGTADETAQVTNNRDAFTIIDHTVNLLKTTINFGGSCPFRNQPGDACARVYVYWKSVAKKDTYDDFGVLYARAGQQVEAGPAIDQMAAKYYRDKQQWRLCDSSFDPDHTSLRASTIRGMVP